MTRVLMGGVGYRWMGDASFGLAVSDALAREEWPADVEVADLGYGALYASLDLGDRRPHLDRLILVTAVERGRERGELFCSRWMPRPLDDEDVQARIREAGGGIIDIDHLLVVAQHFQALPGEVITIELEPCDLSGGSSLSDLAAQRLTQACAMARSLALAPSDHYGASSALAGAATERDETNQCV